MAFTRLTPSAILLTLGLGTVHLFATGGGYDEVPIALDYYLQRVPAKSVSQIYAEMGDAASSAQPIELPHDELIRDFSQGPSAKLVGKIDHLLAQSRSPYAGPIQINLLQDLRDVAGNQQATGTEMGAYARWRFDHLDVFKKAEMNTWEKPKLPQTGLPEIEAEISKSSKPMLAHWLYLKGAFYYMNGDDTQSETYFDRVLSEFPNNPRAEPALFMKGRCRLSQSVTQNDDGMQSDATKKDEAKVIFQSYLSKYPKGRYLSDVIGWLGGVAYRSSDPAAALGYYTRQLEMKDHPENFGAALVMIEKVLARERPDNQATLDEVAEHPPVALALAYFALNFTQAKEGDNDQDYDVFNAWRHAVLPKLGQAVLRHKNLYQGEAWQDRYLAILIHAASDQGDQKQALDLIAMGNKSPAANDDFLFAKAMVLQRSGTLADAEKTYRELLAKFPKSPLFRGARYRLALTLHDQKRDGEALLELAALRDYHLSLRGLPPAPMPAAGDEARPADEPSALGIDYSGAPDEEVAQTMDAILNFAPLPELETALKAAGNKGQEEFRGDLSQVLQERYLDHDDFRQAARFSDMPQVRKQWTTMAEKSDALEKSTGPETAKACQDMADFWVTNRKILPAMPLDSLDTRNSLLFGSDADTHRAVNATLLSYPHPEDELESREGLWHAIKWWSKASATHESAIAPAALWSIIKSRRTIAEVNPYTWKRAIDGQAGPDSKADYDQLMAKYPNSPEASHAAAYWSFSQTLPRSGYERYSVGYDRDNLSEDWLTAMGLSRDAYFYDENWRSTQDKFKQLTTDAGKIDAKEFAQRVTALRADIGKNATSIEDANRMNCLNDLVQFSQIDGIAPDIRATYVKARVQLLYGVDRDLSGPAEPQVDLAAFRRQPGTEKIQDFIDFLDLARTAGQLIDVPVKDLEKDGQPMTISCRNYQALLPQATAFLEKYPKSPKREAARLLQIRAIVRSSRPKEVPWSIDWPAANQWDDEYAPRFLTLAPFDEKQVNDAFGAYVAEFPHGQYANAILALRADTALIQKHWGEALDDLLSLLDQQTAPELHNGSAGELAYIFDQLDKDDRRQEVLNAILKRPMARKDLTAYLATDSLSLLKDYLNSKLGGP
jgi:TolA-binding protein